jgi:L-ribulose-5-phosphate 3-epimerase
MKRRTFLHRTALATAAGLMAPAVLRGADEPPKKRALKKAIMYGTLGGLKGSVAEKFRMIKEAGFEGVEAMGGMDPEEVTAAQKETGLKIPSVCCHTHWAKPLSDPNPEVRKVGLEGLQSSLRDAKRYGATSVLLVPAVVNKQVSYADAYKRSQEEIRKAIPTAEEAGVVIAIENVWNQFLLSPLESARYVDEFQSKWVGWHFDIGNIINFGFPEQWIRVLGKRIQKLHIKEYSRKKRDKEGPGAGFGVDFLEGDNDWPAIMKALDEIGYNGWGIAEQGGPRDLAVLKNLSERMDRIFAS